VRPPLDPDSQAATSAGGRCERCHGAVRRAAVCGLILLLAVSALSATATAAPTVKLKVEPVPIAGYPGTGYILGHGTALEADYTIEGTEYNGFPAPLIGVSFFLPRGTRLHAAAFPTCPIAVLEPSGKGPAACPPGSAAGPAGRVLGVVAFGGELVPEEATVQPYYAPGGGLEFFTAGHSPVSLEVLSSGHYVNVDSAVFGQELVSQVPLVQTVPGAPDASVKSISVKVGSAIRVGGKTVYYGVLPSTCPKGGFTVRSELTFAGLAGLTQTTVPVSYRAPCPRR